MDASISSLIRLVGRWWWLFVVGMLVGGGVGYGVSARAEPVYSSSVLLQVNALRAEDTFDPSFIEASQVIALTYRQVVWNREVLQPVITELDLPYDLDELRASVFAWTLSGTGTLEVSVQDSDPDRAADIANAVADSLIRHIESETLAMSEPARAAIDEQIQLTQSRIDEVNAEIIALEQNMEEGDLAATEQLEQLRTTRDELNETSFSLQAARQQMDIDTASNMSPLSITAPAEADPAAVESSRMALVFGSGFGLFVAGAVVLGLGYFDKSLRPTTDVQALVGAPVLGLVGGEPSYKSAADALFVSRAPEDPASEAIRAIRLGASLRLRPEGRRVVAIAGPERDEGTRVLSANLAVAAAQAGLRTVLIDGDLRKPLQHRLFSIQNDRGLTTWLKYHSRVSRVSDYWRDLARESGTENLVVIPSGPSMDMPSDLQLSTGRLGPLLKSIGDDVDLVIVDTPSVIDTNDALLIAMDVDAVMLVCRPSRTSQSALVKAAEMLAPTETPLLGVVFSMLSGVRTSRRAAASEKRIPEGSRTQSAPPIGSRMTEGLADTGD